MYRRLWSSLVRGLALGVIAVGLTVALASLPPVRRLESLSYDGRLELENRLRPIERSDEIVIVGIDDQALLNFGRWPWPREYLADGVEALSSLGARSILMDIELPEPSRGTRAAQGDGFAHFVRQMQTFALEQLGADTALLREKLAGLGLDPVTLAPVTALVDQVVANCHTILQRSWTDPDRELAAAIRRARGRGTEVISAYHVEPPRTETDRLMFLADSWLENDTPDPPATPAARSPNSAEEQRLAGALRAVLRPVREGREIALDTAFLDPDPAVRELMRRYGVELRERSLSHLASRALDDASTPGADPRAVLEAAREKQRERSGAFLRAIDTEASRRRIRQVTLPQDVASTGGLHPALELVPPIPEVALEVDHLGVINILPDADGHIRSAPLLWSQAGHVLPSALLSLILVHLQVSPANARIELADGPTMLVRRAEGGALLARLPVTREGRLLIRFSGTYEKSFPVISAGLLLDYRRTASEKEDWFKKQMRGNLYAQVLLMRDIAARVSESAPGTELSLADLVEQLKKDHPFFLHVLAETVVSSFGGKGNVPLDVATRRPARDWVPALESLQQKLEESHLSFQKAMATSLESITDPAERERKRAKIGPMIEPYRKYVEVAESLRASLKERITGRHCVLGMTSSSSTDLGTTPLEARSPLLQIFPQGLNTVLQQKFVTRRVLLESPVLPGTDLGALVLVAVLCVPLFTLLTSVWGGVTVITLSSLWIILSTWLFVNRGVWVDMVSPVLLILISFALIFVWRARQRESLEQLFGRYLTGEVAAALMSDDSQLELGGRQRVVTIMMTDLRGFTKLSEELGPKRMVSLLNEYLSRMTDPILELNGTINEFIGDAILVLFGAPLTRDDDVDRALACGIAMQLALGRFNEENTLRGLPALTMGIGINTGEVVAGNIGSLKRAKYGVVGDTVNTAARVESLTIGSQILITAATAAACKGVVDLCEPTEVRLKGKSEPLVIRELRGIQYRGVWYRMPVETSVPWAHVELRARFSFLKGKTVSDEVETANVISVNPGACRMTTTARLELSQDVVMHIAWAEESSSRPIYGRVAKQNRQRVEGKAELTWAEIVFTAMDDADRVLLDGMKRDVAEKASPLGEA